MKKHLIRMEVRSMTVHHGEPPTTGIRLIFSDESTRVLCPRCDFGSLERSCEFILDRQSELQL